MSFEGLRPLADATAGDWIAPRLDGFGGRVNQNVPDGLAAYVRLFHPAEDASGRLVTWADACRRLGRTAHALMQWRSVARVGSRQVDVDTPEGRQSASEYVSDWPGIEPREGSMPAETFEILLDVLAGFTTTPDSAFHAVWDGFGWMHGGMCFSIGSDEGGQSHPRSGRVPPEDVPPTAHLHHPGREFLLYEGPLTAALRIGETSFGRFSLQSPNLLWPADRAWCLATEIDFDSTVVAGSADLARALVAAPGLEAWPVEPTDDLSYAGDRVNSGRATAAAADD